ncbi:2'-5' RNA ligase family protein [Roseomonas nepalensis]|uniref:2'-5' RNA ligase family protein n=1 Tax=Muricoccus nepalensis TaxID=1854500 RepID=A0A502G1C7_9PROT|nr:2'-5' RNA ligase family protein [Roseomonas nepalensis]TPG55658.1 2'-5' RNA ligase family protein [Roseomonas nepalensis]
MTADPLILTLGFDEVSFARLDALRRAHFPPERNQIPAHLTLFHALPGDALDEVLAGLRTACASTAPFDVRFTGPRSLGRGVALEAASPPLLALRKALAYCWSGWLTRQDAQGFRPHVTVQNKVTAEAAAALLASLSAGFEPWEARGEGLLLWHYRGGPWERAASLPFAGGAAP